MALMECGEVFLHGALEYFRRPVCAAVGSAPKSSFTVLDTGKVFLYCTGHWQSLPLLYWTLAKSSFCCTGHLESSVAVSKTTLGKLLRGGGAYMGFSERIDTILN